MTPPINLGILAASGGGIPEIVYRIQGMKVNSGRITDISLDSSYNCYINSYSESNAFGSVDSQVSKYAPDGTLLLQRVIGDSTQQNPRGGTVDDLGNYYIVNQWNSERGEGVVTKLDSSFSTLWSKYADDGVSEALQIDFGPNSKIDHDSSGNVYIAGRLFESNADRDEIALIKYNSSGSVVFQKYYGENNTNDEYGYSLTIDRNSNAIYIAGTALLKLDLNGNVQWAKRVSLGSTIQSVTAVDDNGNIYTGGKLGNSTGILKWNSSGDLQWGKFCNTNVGDISSIKTDTEGNVYGVTTEKTDFGIPYENACHLFKFNSSGTLQWQRRLTSFQDGAELLVDDIGTMYIGGRQHTTNEEMLWVLPTDGSLTGSYTFNGRAAVYEATSYTFTNTLPSVVTETYLPENSSAPILNSGWSNAATSFANSITTI